jgi:transposase-like protein
MSARCGWVWAAAEASVEGHGGVTAVARATGIARSTLHRGVVDLEAEPLERPRVRGPWESGRLIHRGDRSDESGGVCSDQPLAAV